MTPQRARWPSWALMAADAGARRARASKLRDVADTLHPDAVSRDLWDAISARYVEAERADTLARVAYEVHLLFSGGVPGSQRGTTSAGPSPAPHPPSLSSAVPGGPDAGGGSSPPGGARARAPDGYTGTPHRTEEPPVALGSEAIRLSGGSDPGHVPGRMAPPFHERTRSAAGEHDRFCDCPACGSPF